MLPAKFHVVSRLLTVLKIEILMLACQCSCNPLKISFPENETMVNLKSFVVIMLLHDGWTHIQSQIKLWLLFGESFTLSKAHVQLSPKTEQRREVSLCS